MLRYRLRRATIAVHQGGARPVAMTIPSGTILKVADNTVNADGFVEVECGGEIIQIFAVDLRERGELVKAMSATSSAR
jgi:hypothetical protein